MAESTGRAATRRLVVAVAVGVAIAAVGVWVVGSRGGPAATVGEVVGPRDGLAADGRRLGVRGDSVDPARRDIADGPSRGRRVAVEGAVRGRRNRTEGTPTTPYREPPPPDPAIPPSAAAVAEGEAMAAARPAVLAAVERSLADGHADIRRACWTGELPAAASIPVEATYAADGTLVALSVAGSREAPAVGACVRGLPSLVPSTIAAPGVGVTVQASVNLP